MARIVFLLALLAFTGCAGQSPTPTGSLAVPDSPDVAYQRAVRTLTSMGGLLSATDPQSRTVQAHMQGTRIITVQVTPTASGSLVQARGQIALSVMGGMFGTSIADDFLKAYQTTR